MPYILRLLKWISILLDVLALNTCLALSYVIYFGFSLPMFRLAMPYVLIINFGWLFVQSFFKIYDNFEERNSVAIFRRTINAYISFGFCLSIVFILSLQNDKVNDYFSSHAYAYGTALLLFACLLGINRLILLSIRKANRQNLNVSRKNIVIVGQSPNSGALHHLMSANLVANYNVMAIFHDQLELTGTAGSNGSEALYRGNTTDCIPFMRNNRVDELFCALPGMSKESINVLMHEADRNLTRFRLVPDYSEFFHGRISIEMINNIAIMSGRQEPLENIQNAAFKRLFDIAFSLFVIVFLLSWLTPIIALLIKLESRGPVFFSQLRSGRNNQPFYCLKFRSMKVNDNADKLQATKNDSRITRLGAFMRKTSLDELPQFFNVLLGNMSIVGPRPHMLAHTAQYAALIDKFMVRHFLKPGITGWAQVSGLRGETKTTEDMAKRVEADVWYLENWSFLLDLKIIFLTVWNVFKGEGNAY